MENGKSPGIDGIPIEFYKEFLETITNDLQKTFNETLINNQKIPKTWNQAIITLIPKKGNTKILKYWRPISLLCVYYKILTKILANRFKNILPDIISEEQNCSIPNRSIFNNLFLTRDVIQYTKEKNKHLYILQIDQEKALDKIDRNFLYKTMEKMGISPKSVNFIKILYKQNISMISNNGYLSPQVLLQRGLRQGCPLSLPLYVIQGQVTNINININKDIIGIHIPNQKEQVKISQYADDSNFFKKTEESVKNTLNFFKILNKATGTTINLEKTIVLPINVDETEQIQKIKPKITIKYQFETIKTLGIYYNESLKNACLINWDNALEKMEKHINMLSPMILSLYEKTTIINTLILSKTSYISNVFPMNAETINKIHKKIFTYLWKNKKTEPIARKTIHLPRKSGGLNLLEPEAHNYAMRIKHLLTLKQKEKRPSWKNIAAHWLTIDKHNYTQEYNFLMNTNRTKTLNKKKAFYYNDIINYIKDQNRNITKIKPETKTIYKKIIEEGTKQHTIIGEKEWKKHVPNINF